MDSPVLSALRQILPYFASGVFSPIETPIFLQSSRLLRAQLYFTQLPRDIDIRRTGGWHKAAMELKEDAVVFYPYNSASNLFAVSNRKSRHVLTLHGESNKMASNLPAARIYDYISIAGPLARDRYLSAGIFTPDDVDRGRLVMMGDSYVQDMSWIASEQEAHGEPALFYSPTWEGYGNGNDDYNSITGGIGFDIVAEAAKAIGTDRIVVKPHPYLGLLRPSVLRDFVAGVKSLAERGLKPELALADASRLVSWVSRLQLRDIARFTEDSDNPLPVRLAICDVSGMEAVFLKQNISHMVYAGDMPIPASLADFYHRKVIGTENDIHDQVRRYADDADEIHLVHRSRVFGWYEPSLADQSGTARRNWLTNYVRKDPFWGRN